MTKGELTLFRDKLFDYFIYVMNNPDTFIAPVIGLYKLEISFQTPIYFMIMKNILYTPIRKLKMHKIYDIKGSRINREAKVWKIDLNVDQPINDVHLDGCKLTLKLNNADSELKEDETFGITPKYYNPRPDTGRGSIIGGMATKPVLNYKQPSSNQFVAFKLIRDSSTNDDEFSTTSTKHNNASSVRSSRKRNSLLTTLPSPVMRNRTHGNKNYFKNPEISILSAVTIDESETKTADVIDIKFELNGKNDVKGSMLKRDRILKDMDFINDQQYIKIGSKRKELFMKQLRSDIEFLRDIVDVMDYSMLVGVHYVDTTNYYSPLNSGNIIEGSS